MPWAARRLRSRGEFQRVFRHGIRLDGGLFLLVAARSEQLPGRLGLAASRRVGGAVKRNRARRLLREVYRLQDPVVVSGFDLVVVVKPELARSDLAKVQREFERRVERLGEIQRRRCSTRAAVGD